MMTFCLLSKGNKETRTSLISPGKIRNEKKNNEKQCKSDNTCFDVPYFLYNFLR